MECRLTHSDRPWQCQVLLRREIDANGNKIQAREEPFGPVLYDKDELEEMLRRAQLAILNPSLPPKSLVDFDTKSLDPGQAPPGSERQLQFSDDVVCLDLSSPDVTDLSFIDLPGTCSPACIHIVDLRIGRTGIISNVAKGEDRGNIDAVRNMVSKHIQGNTLILLTITMRGECQSLSNTVCLPTVSLLDDIDNQGAAHLARLADEDGLRTIGLIFLFCCILVIYNTLQVYSPNLTSSSTVRKMLGCVSSKGPAIRCSVSHYLHETAAYELTLDQMDIS